MPLTFKLYKNFLVFSFQMQCKANACENDKCYEETKKLHGIILIHIIWVLGFHNT